MRLHFTILGVLWLGFTFAARGEALELFAPGAYAHPQVIERAEGWRERTLAMPAVDCGATPLAERYCKRSAALRPTRSSVKTFAHWVREVSGRAYTPDVGGDHWGTLDDMLTRQAGDCDDLATLAYHALTGIGERATMAVIHHPKKGGHMVVLWFQDGEGSAPRVVDPTGLATRRLARLNSDGRLGSWRVFGHFDTVETFSIH